MVPSPGLVLRCVGVIWGLVGFQERERELDSSFEKRFSDRELYLGPTIFALFVAKLCYSSLLGHPKYSSLLGPQTRKSRVRKSKFENNFPRTKNEAPATLQPTPMLGWLVPMVPLAGVGASALESY